MRDANIDNTDILEQFFGMDTATSMDEFIDAHRTANGDPVGEHDRHLGRRSGVVRGHGRHPQPVAGDDRRVAGQRGRSVALASVVLDNGAILLNGSDPANEWVDDPAATRPGILPFDEQPQLERDDFVFNANDSHWLANPAQLLTGYSPLTGPEGVPQSARTRENAILLTDPSLRGDDGTFTLDELQAAWFSNRGLHADLLKDQVVKACDEQGVVLVEGVPFDISPGVRRSAQLGRSPEHRLEGGGAVARVPLRVLRRRPLERGQPVRRSVRPGRPRGHTQHPGRQHHHPQQPRGRDDGAGEPGLGARHRTGRRAVRRSSHDERIAIPGGTNLEGAISIVDCCSGANTFAPAGDPGESIDGRYFSSVGYPVTFGNSFVMVMEFTADGPNARAILTYGQPDDPADPNFTAQTKVYSSQQLRPVLFTADDIATGAVGDTITVTGERA
jgi:acyl-homoserine-lactone acylase